MAAVTLSAANSSRMMPKDSGKEGAADALDRPGDDEDADVRREAPRAGSRRQGDQDATSVRFLPIRSPTRPRIGVKIEADEQIRGHHPGRGGLRGVQGVLDGRQAPGRSATGAWRTRKAPVARTAKVRRVELRGMETSPEGQGTEQVRPGRLTMGRGRRWSEKAHEVRGGGARPPRLIKWRYASTLAEARPPLSTGTGGDLVSSRRPRDRPVAPHRRDRRARRPHRRDAARNYDALLSAAREVFAETGRRRPGGHRPPGGGGHRHALPELPHPPPSLRVASTRTTSTPCAGGPGGRRAGALGGAQASWLAGSRLHASPSGRFARPWTASRRSSGLPGVDAPRRAGRSRTGTEAGQAGADMDFVDLLRMVAGITATDFLDDAQRDRVVVALDGVRAPR